MAIIPQITDYVPTETDMYLGIGKTYCTKSEVKNALCLHAISECSQYKIVKSKLRALTAVCVDKECKWRVRFTMLGQSSYFTTTKYNSTHTCSFQLRRSVKREASYNVIAEKVKSM